MLVIIDVKPKDLGLPTEAYISVEEIHDVSQVTLHCELLLCLCLNDVNCNFKDGTPTSKTFEHVTSEIGAEEAEEVGVEHLLR